MSDNQEYDQQDMFRRINGMVNFMRNATSDVDPDEVMAVTGLTNLDHFSESQLTFLLVKAGIYNPKVKELFQVLKDTPTIDIRLINMNNETFRSLIIIAGGLYFAKSIRRFIQKKDIMTIRGILGEQLHKIVIDFSQDKDCLEDYPFRFDYEQSIYAIGHRCLGYYLEELHPLIREYLFTKVTIEDPALDLSHLRISKNYALKLIYIGRQYIMDNLEKTDA